MLCVDHNVGTVPAGGLTPHSPLTLRSSCSHARQCRQRGGELCQREATRVSQAWTAARWCSSRRESPMMWMASSPTARSDDATFPAET